MSVEFLKMVSELYSQRYLVKLQSLIANKVPCGFFCGLQFKGDAANISEIMKKSGINLICVCTASRAGKTGGGSGVPVVTLEEFPNFEPKPSVMFHVESTAGPIFGEYFQRYGVGSMLTFANIDIMEGMYGFYMKHLPEIYSVYDLLADEESKKVFMAFIKGKLTQRIEDFRYAPEPQYFLEGFFPTGGDIAIDGGAYDGGTARDFAMQGAEVYSFEMDEKNYRNCLARAKKYKFTVENMGLINQENEDFYIQGNTGSRKGGNSGLIAKFIDLDTYVIRKDLPRVDYIKLDIEGAELDMLHGAAKTIARWKPKMAVSAYHKPEDLFTLATYIKSVRSDYEFKFRHYRMDCTDYVLNTEEKEILKKFGLNYFLPTVAESVLYCR